MNTLVKVALLVGVISIIYLAKKSLDNDVDDVMNNAWGDITPSSFNSLHHGLLL